jgi:small subunit ribosomal protein S16
MSVKIRLTRRGRKKKAMYDVIVADARASRDGKFIEKLGTYVPLTNPATIEIDEQKAVDWLIKGAQPTDTVRRILSYKGLMLKKHLQIGANKGAITQEQADKKFEEWLAQKDAVVTKKVSTLAEKKAASAKERLEAEKKVKEAKAEALRKKLTVVEASAESETPEEEVATTDDPVVEAISVEEVAEVEETITEVEATAKTDVAEVEDAPEAASEEKKTK